jgi:hypothetical protein
MISASRIISLVESILRLDERNVLNLDDIEEFLKEVATAGHWSFEATKWLGKRGRLYLINEYAHILNTYTSSSRDNLPSNTPQWVFQALDRGEEVYDIDLRQHRREELSKRFELIMAFFSSPERMELNRIDALSVDQAYGLAEKWYGRMLKAKIDKQDLLDVQLVKDYGNIRWVRLFTKLSLDREGQELNHCLDGGSFDNNLRYYSLRDSRNKPHATLEVDKRYISQIKGHSNGPIEDEYLDCCRDFINTYLKPSEINDDDLVNIFSVFDDGKVREGLSLEQIANLVANESYTKPQLEMAVQWMKRRIDEPVYYEAMGENVPLIIISIHKGDEIATKMFVKYGADLQTFHQVKLPWHKGWMDLTPLMFACCVSVDDNMDLKDGYEEIISELIPGSDMSQADPNYYETPLFMMYSYELNDLYELMLKKGADPNHEASQHRTPLTVAIEDGNEERVAILIQYGAKVTEEHLEKAESEDREDIAIMLAKVLGLTDYEYGGN